MNIFLFIYYQYALLFSSVGLGILWLVLLFVLCLVAVHVARLAKLGWTYSKIVAPQKTSKTEPQGKSVKEEKTAPTEPQNPSQPVQEPIYYIVERKKKRSKASYGEPKEIRFK